MSDSSAIGSFVIGSSPIGGLPPGPFPLNEVSTLTQTIPSYLYQEYSDDDDLQAFVAAFNALANEYVVWFAQCGLPIYTYVLIAGTLLDWVAQGLYGISRPALPSGLNQNLGPFNTYQFNQLEFNERVVIGPQDYTATSDDTFKRIITWNFFKGDGRIFSVRWLKRRIMRFLYGVNGVNYNVDNTYQISVTFGLDSQININLLNGLRTITGGAIFGRFGFNAKTFNELDSSYVAYPPITMAAIFKSAVNAGVLQLPFAYSYVVNI